nr:hypothetical protein [Tanacetum cinerariifolium]
MALELMAKTFQLNNTTPTNNNQRSSLNPCYSQIAQSAMNIDQYRHMLMVDDNVGNQFRQNANGLSVVPGIANQHGNRNVVAAQAEGNSNGINENPIRCYSCQEEDHYASACEETERDNANCTLENNLQQVSTSSTQSYKPPVYDTDGSAEVHLSKNCYDNDIFNMFTQKEQYTELLEPIPEPHQVPQNDSNVIFEVSSVEQGGRTVEQYSATVEETLAYHESLFHNLAADVEKVNSVNRKIKETNDELTTELARYKNQEKCFEIKKKRLKSGFNIREDELLDKQIQLENKIKELDNILVKTDQSIQTMHMLSPKPDSFYHTEQKMALGYQNPFYLKQAQQKQQSLYNGKGLLENHDPPAMYDSEETLELAQEMTPAQTKTIIDSLQNKLHDMIYENAKLRAQLFDKVSEQKDTTKGTSVNTLFCKQSILGKPPSSGSKLYSVTPFLKSLVLPKDDKTNALSKPFTSNPAPSIRESKGVQTVNVIAPRIFRTNPSRTFRVDNVFPNKPVKASIMTN